MATQSIPATRNTVLPATDRTTQPPAAAPRRSEAPQKDATEALPDALQNVRTQQRVAGLLRPGHRRQPALTRLSRGSDCAAAPPPVGSRPTSGGAS